MRDHCWYCGKPVDTSRKFCDDICEDKFDWARGDTYQTHIDRIPRAEICRIKRDLKMSYSKEFLDKYFEGSQSEMCE